MMTADVFTDTATLRTRTQTGTNDLGEPTFSDSDRTLTGLLVRRLRQHWTELGLVGTVDAVFLTTETIAEIPAGAVLVAEGVTYRRVALNRRADLWGDDGVTRLILEEAGA
ncbi:MAG: hypothetical protein AB1824_01300 [Acidobacteriota bacterium]